MNKKYKKYKLINCYILLYILFNCKSNKVEFCIYYLFFIRLRNCILHMVYIKISIISNKESHLNNLA